MNECLLAICLALAGPAPDARLAVSWTEPALAAAAADTTPRPRRGAAEAPRDRLFGEDKWTHFFTSFILTSLSATGARAAGLDRDASLLVGAGVGAGLGIAKELRDVRDPMGDASFLDLAWDLAGTGAGVAAAAQAR